jgi:hypothetical protein
VPPPQTSTFVVALPSSQVVPFGRGVTAQDEVPLQLRVLHWSEVQVMVVPAQTPLPLQVSL